MGVHDNIRMGNSEFRSAAVDRASNVCAAGYIGGITYDFANGIRVTGVCYHSSPATEQKHASEVRDTPEMLTQIDAEHGQVDLVPGNDKGYLLVDELLAPCAVDSCGNVDDLTFPPLTDLELLSVR